MSLWWVEYKTQTTVPLADGPLAAALWGREMDFEGTSEGDGLEAIVAYSVLLNLRRRGCQAKFISNLKPLAFAECSGFVCAFMQGPTLDFKSGSTFAESIIVSKNQPNIKFHRPCLRLRKELAQKANRKQA